MVGPRQNGGMVLSGFQIQYSEEWVHRQAQVLLLFMKPLLHAHYDDGSRATESTLCRQCPDVGQRIVLHILEG